MSATELAVYAGAALGLGAVVLSLLRNTVSKVVHWLWNSFWERFMLSVTFNRTDPGFDMIRDWLAAHPYANSAHRVKLVWDPETTRFNYVPGPGVHYIWYKRRPLVVTYGRKDAANSWDHAQESYQITVFGRDRKRLEGFIDEISCFRRVDQEDRMLVWTLSGGSWIWTRKRKRSMDTVYMPEKQKREVIEYVKSFINNEAWYHVRGIPHRLGLSLEGPPGSGKTTLATALAGLLDRPIYLMNLSTVGSDDSLMKAFLGVERDGIILIEDIDSYGVALKRVEGDQPEESPTAIPTDPSETPKNEAPGGIAKQHKEKQYGVTLSGLLNAIDGVAATEGRILLMTTNHPEKLDPALVRAGRVDRRVHIGALAPTEVEHMFRCFYPEAVTYLPEVRRYAEQRVMTAANWQALFIRYHDSSNGLMEEVIRPSLALAARDSL